MSATIPPSNAPALTGDPTLRTCTKLAIVLTNLGGLDEQDTAHLAQAVWLTTRVAVSIEDFLPPIAELLQRVGATADAAPLLATFGLHLARVRAEHHPQQDELLRLSAGMLGACAEARQIGPEQFRAWFERERLNDPSYFLPALTQALEALVGESGWLFDRTKVPDTG